MQRKRTTCDKKSPTFKVGRRDLSSCEPRFESRRGISPCGGASGLLLSSAANPTVVGSMVILPTFAVAHDRIDFASAQAPMISRIDASTGSLSCPERSVAFSAAAAALCGQRGRSDAEGERHRESKRRLVQHVNLLGWFVGRVHQRWVRD